MKPLSIMKFGLAATAITAIGVSGTGLLMSAANMHKQNTSFESFKLDPDRFNCQGGKELPIQKKSFWNMFFHPHSQRQSFLCKDGTTVSYNLANGTKKIAIPSKILPFLNERIVGDGKRTFEVTLNLKNLAKEAVKRAKAGR